MQDSHLQHVHWGLRASPQFVKRAVLRDVVRSPAHLVPHQCNVEGSARGYTNRKRGCRPEYRDTGAAMSSSVTTA